MKFVKNIQDDVHGFVPITKIEYDIIQLPIFKRLQDIKQLSLTSWVFPGSEHTRYSHSIGVMHIIDKIAIQLNFKNKDRQIVRLAGLLHDIGHYPLSHVGELGYKNSDSSDEFIKQLKDFVSSETSNVKSKIDKLDNSFETEFFKYNNNIYHHEKLSASIVRNSAEIRDLLKEKYNTELSEVIDTITSMIIGHSYDDKNNIKLKIQMLHSEIDADRLDYLLRDSKSSGTKSGNINIDYLIGNMVKGTYKGTSILCIKEKAISSADQYLLSRYYAYTSVIFHDKVIFLGTIAEKLIRFCSITGKPPLEVKSNLKMYMIDDTNFSVVPDFFMKFNDRAFWSLIDKGFHNTDPKILDTIKDIIYNKDIKKCNDSTEIKMFTNDYSKFIKKVRISGFWKRVARKGTLPIFQDARITEHVPIKEFTSRIKKKDMEKKLLNRMIDGLSILKDNRKVVLLVDCESSLISRLYDSRFFSLREYNI